MFYTFLNFPRNIKKKRKRESIRIEKRFFGRASEWKRKKKRKKKRRRKEGRKK